MKTKFNFLFWLFAIIPLAFMSCDDDDNTVVETTLETSTQAVTFTKDGGDQAVTVTTNATKWVATSPVEGQWVTLAVSGDQVSVKAAANNTGADRKSYILINAGNASAKIELMQSAGDAALFLTPETVNFGKAGGEQRVDVIGATDFTVEVEAAAAEWLTTNYQPGADFFNVVAAAGAEARTGKVIVTAGNNVKELIVNQGAAAEKFILPYIGVPATYTDAFQFEINRGHALSNVPQMFGNEYYEFSTGNADCPMLGYWYEMAAGDETYTQASALYTNAALFTEDQGAAFKTFMEEKGFVYDEGTGQFAHPELPYVVYYTNQQGVVQVNAIYQPKQKDPQPTFSAVPTVNRKHLLHFAEGGVHGGTLEDVAAWEAENGGTFGEESPENAYTGYDVADGAESLTRRGYWDEKEVPDFIGEISATQDIYTDLSRVYYIDEGTGTMYETTEFQKLMSDNGFVYLGSNSQGFQFYGNEEIQLGMLAFEQAPGEMVVQFQGMKIGGAPSVKSILLDSETRLKFLKKVNDHFKVLNDGRITVPYRN